MPSLKRVLPLLLSLLAFVVVSLTGLSATRPFAHEGSDLKADPAITYGKLPNGIRYAVRANKEPKGRAALRFVVLAGSFNESEAQRGLAHYLEHLSFDGSTHYPPGSLIEFFQRMGMDFGGDTNAYTSFDQTVYMIDLPDTKKETLAEGLRVFSDYADGLLLDAKQIDKERKIILAEERARDSVELRTFLAQAAFVYPNTLIPKRLPIGDKAVIEKAGRDLFLDLYNTWYRPDHLCVVVVGDFDATAVEKQVIEAMSPAKARAPERAEPVLGAAVDFKGLRVKFHPEPEASATRVMLSSVVSYTKEPDTKARNLRLLTRNLATSMLNRRLSILAKKEGSPFTSARASVDETFDFLREADMTVSCKPEQWQAAIGIAEQELRRALEHGFQKSELKEAVAQMRNQLEQAVKTASTRRSPELAKEIVQGFTDTVVVTSPEDDLALLAPALDIATPEACAAALREAWSTDRRFLFVTGNTKIEGNAEAALTAAYEASRKVAVAAPEKLTDEAFAYADFGKPATVVKRERVEDLDLTLVEFSNGVRLNLKKTDFEAGVVHIAVRAGYGRLSEPRAVPGVAAFSSSAFHLGGLGKHSIDDLQRLLAGKTVGTQFRVLDDAFAFGGRTNQQDLLLQLQLITASIADPGYRAEATRMVAKNIEQAYNRLEHTPDGPLQIEVPRELACGDPRFGMPTRQVMTSRKLEETRAWMTPQLKRGAIEVAIVGDLDLEAAIQAVAKTLGALPAREPRPDFTAERAVSMPAKPLTGSYVVDTKIPKAVLEVDWPTTDAMEAKVSRRLNMLAEVLNDRLRVKVREQLGNAYSPQAGSRPSQTYTGYGFISARITVDPAQAQKVKEVVLGLADDMATKGISDDELLRAKNPTLTSIRESLRTNGYWLNTVLARAQEKPVMLDWARTRSQDVEAITVADLNALAKQYLPQSRASTFIVSPK